MNKITSHFMVLGAILDCEVILSCCYNWTASKISLEMRLAPIERPGAQTGKRNPIIVSPSLGRPWGCSWRPPIQQLQMKQVSLANSRPTSPWPRALIFLYVSKESILSNEHLQSQVILVYLATFILWCICIATEYLGWSYLIAQEHSIT